MVVVSKADLATGKQAEVEELRFRLRDTEVVLMSSPTAGARGAHVVVANRRAIFDCRGWSPLAFLSKFSLPLYAKSYC